MQDLILSLLLAVSNVESGNDNQAIGDGGRSRGRLQIQLSVIRDVNRIYGTDYDSNCRYSPSCSADIFCKYLLYYGRCYERKTGHKADLRVLARIWNGGPNGWQKTSTVNYWRQVQSQLSENSLVVSER